VRDQDGGAHTDSDEKLRKNSPDYVELVNSFPISKHSAIQILQRSTLVWNQLPAVTLPILRQIAHKMLSALFSQSDLRTHIDPPSLVCLFKAGEMKGAFVPEDYPDIGPIYGTPATRVARKAR
jgi:hypothetical protein